MQFLFLLLLSTSFVNFTYHCALILFIVILLQINVQTPILMHKDPLSHYTRYYVVILCIVSLLHIDAKYWWEHYLKNNGPDQIYFCTRDSLLQWTTHFTPVLFVIRLLHNDAEHWVESHLKINGLNRIHPH